MQYDNATMSSDMQWPLTDAAAPLLSDCADVITLVMQRMSLTDLLACAPVCKAWAEAATATLVATSSSIRSMGQDLSCLQDWLETHGASKSESFNLHECHRQARSAPPQLQGLPTPSLSTSAGAGLEGELADVQLAKPPAFGDDVVRASAQ